MIAINLGYKDITPRQAKYYVKKNAFMYLGLFPKDLHYWNMNNYLAKEYGLKANLSSICYNIIARSDVINNNKNYSVVINPKDELLYKLITYGTRNIKGIDIINKALITLK